MKRFVWLMVLAGVTIGSAWAQDKRVQFLKGFRLPDYDSQGQLRWEIKGETAAIRPDGLIDITDIAMTFYENGQVVMKVTSPRCLFDRLKQTATSDASVRVARKEIVISGVGFSWDIQKGTLEIEDEAKVALKNVREQMNQEKLP